MKQYQLPKSIQPILDSLRDLLPIVVVVSIFQLLVIRQPLPNYVDLLLGILFVAIGLSLFVKGLEMGLFPIGQSMAQSFARKGSVVWLLLFAFALGFGTTVAEPALIAEASEIAAAGNLIHQSSNSMESYARGLRYTVALSVGLAIVLGVIRILKGWPIHWLIVGCYVCIIIITEFAPREIIGIAYDSGGVTTSTITVPLARKFHRPTGNRPLFVA